MKKSIVLICLLLSALFVNSQTIQWSYNYTIPGSLVNGYKMAGHSTGYYSAGYLRASAGNLVLRVIKVSPTGSLLNTYSFSYSSSISNIYIKKIMTDGSGNCFVLVETANSVSGRADSYIYALSGSLSLLWINNVDFNFYDRAVDMDFAAGGKILAMVNHNSSSGTIRNIGVKRLNKVTGIIDLSINFTTTYSKTADAISSDVSGNIYLCGRNWITSASSQAMLVKYSSAGTYQWASYYAYPTYATGPLTDQYHDIIIDNSGNAFVAGGGGNVTNSLREGYVRKYSPAGSLTGSHVYSTSGNDNIRFINFDATGNIVVTGTSGSNTVFFRRLNNSLTIIQATGTRSIAGSTLIALNLVDVLVNPNRSVNFMVNTYPGSGTPLVNVNLIKLNGSGGLVFETSAAGSGNQLCAAQATSFPNNEFVALSQYDGTGNWVVRKYTAAAARFVQEEDSHTLTNPIMTAFPNPANHYIALNIESGTFNGDETIYVSDLQGRKVNANVISKEVNDVNLMYRIDVTELPSGMYLMNFQSVDKFSSLKIIVKH